MYWVGEYKWANSSWGLTPELNVYCSETSSLLYLLRNSLRGPAYIEMTQGNSPSSSPKVQHTHIWGCLALVRTRINGCTGVRALGLLWIRVESTVNDGCARSKPTIWSCWVAQMRPKRAVCLCMACVVRAVRSCLSVVRAAVPGPGVTGCVWGCLSECGFLIYYGSWMAKDADTWE
ncbi:hypothetical protein B0H17DRAFT_1123539 [Mycena rosella]|uniref:Uncharacterized protein n=1 Tax=Mycena rosella TaxID=1033263 RepID=A0AAD7H2F8_MYCRO|nr:hypothetical protein B0H17DRAFT_1123539 [Mycena rosella]